MNTLPLSPYDLGPSDEWFDRFCGESDELAPDEFPCICSDMGVCGPCAMEETR